MATQFDSLHFSQRLQAAGVPKNQAEVHASTLAEVIDNCVARPSDLEVLATEFDAKLDSRIAVCEARLTSKIEISEAKLVGMIEACEFRMIARMDAIEMSLRADMAKLETSLRADMAKLETSLRAELNNLRTELRFVKWMNAVTLALVTGMLVKSFVV